jgi:hypothetical protein
VSRFQRGTFNRRSLNVTLFQIQSVVSADRRFLVCLLLFYTLFSLFLLFFVWSDFFIFFFCFSYILLCCGVVDLIILRMHRGLFASNSLEECSSSTRLALILHNFAIIHSCIDETSTIYRFYFNLSVYKAS